MPDLRPLLSPDSIAIVGASADTETLRGRLTHALIGHGYDGRVVPVTRSQNEVLGLRAYPSVAVLPEPVDLAVILVPAAHVVETLEQCGRRGIRAAVVISCSSTRLGHDKDIKIGSCVRRLVCCAANWRGRIDPTHRNRDGTAAERPARDGGAKEILHVPDLVLRARRQHIAEIDVHARLTAPVIDDNRRPPRLVRIWPHEYLRRPRRKIRYEICHT